MAKGKRKKRKRQRKPYAEEQAKADRSAGTVVMPQGSTGAAGGPGEIASTELISTRYGQAALATNTDGDPLLFVPEGLDADDLEALAGDLQHAGNITPEVMAEAIYRRANKIVSEAAVDTYLAILDWFLQLSHGKGQLIDAPVISGGREPTVANDKRAREVASRMWARLRQARVFDIPPTTYGGIYHAADVLASESQGFDWQPEHVPLDDDFDHREFFRRLSESAAAQPWPERTPFDWQFLSFGPGVVHPILNDAFGTDMAGHVFHRYAMLGYLLGPDSCVALIGAYRNARSRRPSTVITFDVGADSKWKGHSQLTFAPWVVNTLIDLINSYRTFIDESPRNLKFRREWQRKMKELGWRREKVLPPPFYPVYLKQKVIERHTRSALPAGPMRAISHRHDRRGHERCLFRRGKLPLDLKTEAKLRARGYRVFTTGPTDLTAHRQLAERGLPAKRADEWLAVKAIWIDAQIIGDPSLPYVPSLHKVK